MIWHLSLTKRIHFESLPKKLEFCSTVQDAGRHVMVHILCPFPS